MWYVRLAPWLLPVCWDTINSSGSGYTRYDGVLFKNILYRPTMTAYRPTKTPKPMIYTLHDIVGSRISCSMLSSFKIAEDGTMKELVNKLMGFFLS